MKCEKCGNEHDGTYGSGRFCSQKCARSFSTSNDKKQTKIVKCITCGIEIEVDKRASSKNCKCVNCRKFNYIEKNKFCIYCGEKLISQQRKFCNTKCQQNFKYEKYIKRWKNGNENGMKGKGGISSYIRRYLKEILGNKCQKCGWNKINPITGNVPIEVEHIDGNYKNNRPENLTLLCPNCHSLTPTYKALNKGNGREYRYLLK